MSESGKELEGIGGFPKKLYLKFDPESSTKYPQGYWYAYSEVLDTDADGATALNAVCSLVDAYENRVLKDRGSAE